MSAPRRRQPSRYPSCQPTASSKTADLPSSSRRMATRSTKSSKKMTSSGVTAVPAPLPQQASLAPRKKRQVRERSVKLAVNCDYVMEGDGNIMVRAPSLPQALEIAGFCQSNLASQLEKKKNAGQLQGTTSVSEKCDIAVHGHDSVLAQVSDGSEDRTLPTSDRGTKEPCLSGKVRKILEEAEKTDVQMFRAVNCKCVFSGEEIKVIHITKPVILGAKGSSSRYNVFVDHRDFSSGYTYGAPTAFAGTHNTSVKLQPQATSSSSSSRVSR